VVDAAAAEASHGSPAIGDAVCRREAVEAAVLDLPGEDTLTSVAPLVALLLPPGGRALRPRLLLAGSATRPRGLLRSLRQHELPSVSVRRGSPTPGAKTQVGGDTGHLSFRTGDCPILSRRAPAASLPPPPALPAAPRLGGDLPVACHLGSACDCQSRPLGRRGLQEGTGGAGLHLGGGCGGDGPAGGCGVGGQRGQRLAVVVGAVSLLQRKQVVSPQTINTFCTTHART